MFLHIREPKAKPNSVLGGFGRYMTVLRGPTPTLFRFYFLVDTVAQFGVRQSGLVCIVIYLSRRICCCAASPFQNMVSAARIFCCSKEGVSASATRTFGDAIGWSVSRKTGDSDLLLPTISGKAMATSCSVISLAGGTVSCSPAISPFFIPSPLY